VPTVAAEARRDLPRARAETRSDLQDATPRRTAFWLRHASRYPGHAPWNPAPLRGLAAGVCPTPAPHIVLQAEVRAVPDHPARLQRLDAALPERGKAGRLPPVVEALQALRGVQCTVAVTTVAEIGDLTRGDTPRELMKFVGLSPSESSSGARRRHGATTTAGTTQARRVLVAGAWAYRSPAQVRRHLHLRLEKQPTAIQASSWKAPVRLCQRYRTLLARGTQAHQVVGAIARALGGFMGAIATAVPGTL